GGYNTSRFGVKGTEDIGGGVKANFVLESAVAADTGAAGSSSTGNFWDRAAWAGLSSANLGELRVGRQNTPIGDVSADAISSGPQPYDTLRIGNTRAADSYRRADNAITYIAPKLLPSLTTTLQYSTGTGTEAAGSNVGKQYGLSVKFVEGPISAGLGYLNIKDANSALANNQKANATLVYAGYDFGVAKATVYYDAETNSGNVASGNTNRLNVLGANVVAPISPEFSVNVGVAKARNVDGEKAGTDNVNITTVRGVYTLSKRTAVYAQFANANNGSTAGRNLGATVTDGKVARGIAVGLRHSF
ncbi:MAG: hypothetical protein RI907_3054, partial [Pseudomonadota bacterium]